jgi:hypothetical protein
MVEAEGGLDSRLSQAIERRHQIGEARVLEGTMVHAVVAHFFGIVAEPGNGQEGDAVVGGIIRHPARGRIAELDLGAEDERVPRDHVVEAARLHGHVMQGGLDGRHGFLPIDGGRDLWSPALFCLIGVRDRRKMAILCKR